MTTDEFRGAVHHNIGTMLDRTDQKRSESVVHDEYNAMLVGDFGNRIKIGDIRIRIAQSLCIDYFGVRTDGLFEGIQVIDGHDGVGYSLSRESVGDQIE